MTEHSKEHRKLRVLIVEDSDDDTTLILRELSLEGYEVEHQRVESAASLREALAQDSWDLLICDHALPTFDSFAALKVVQEVDGDLPFIVVSGKIGEESAVEAIRAGANDYIMKDRMKRLGSAVEREMQNVEERKRNREVEEERERLADQLRQAQKMEAVGQLAGGIAHDFNNLLTVISSYCTVLLKEIGQDNPWHADVSEIEKAGNRAAVLTRQLLAFSRKQIMNPEVIDLGQVVAGMEGVLHRLISERIELDVRVDPQLKKIKADAGQIEQVILNLTVNARDAISQTGSVTVNVRNVAPDDRVGAGVGNGPSLGWVVLSVSDDGMGMDDETRSHIFEPFYTTKGVGMGTGLGLSTVFGIVKQSGGEVEVVSQPGQGSEFRIYFPCVDAAELDTVRQGGQAAPMEGSETILIVEDEEVILNLLKRTHEKLGYTVLVAGDGEEALLVAEQHEGQIDIMITDIIMPKMNGYEVAERLAPLYPKMCVLFTSGYSVATLSAQSRGHLPEQLVHKPFDAQHIAQKIRSILDARPSA